MTIDHDLFLGTDDTGRQFLLRVWHAGGAELATRAHDYERWSAPVELTSVPAEVTA